MSNEGNEDDYNDGTSWGVIHMEGLGGSMNLRQE